MTADEVWVWTTFSDRAVEAFGTFPPANDESALLDVFERQPVAVANALDKVIERHAAGKVTAPWRIWVLEVTSRGNVAVKVGPSREKRIGQAKAWIDNAGLHCDRAGDVELELFGDTVVDEYVTEDGQPIVSATTALLSAWRDDRPLRDELLGYWELARPRGEVTELEALARQERDGHGLRARGWPTAGPPEAVLRGE